MKILYFELRKEFIRKSFFFMMIILVIINFFWLEWDYHTNGGFTEDYVKVHTATFRGQQGRISRTVWAILNGQPSRSAERTFVHSANQYSL